ncbi:hypothetical protein, partial [Xanthomonas sp. MUS 060]|uniref:hypothetical protein n=1 Tax=Xanthomonas sp. MUS 060 TaxID=1588031 RepID=UPI0026F3A77C
MSFDVSVWELFWPLPAERCADAVDRIRRPQRSGVSEDVDPRYASHLSGARMQLTESEGHKDPVYLKTLIRDTQVTTRNFVPSMLRAFVEHGDHDPYSWVKRVICSGEA